MSRGATSSPATNARREHILARSIYQHLRSGGVLEPGVIAVATELLRLVSCDIAAHRRQAETPPAASPSATKPQKLPRIAMGARQTNQMEKS